MTIFELDLIDNSSFYFHTLRLEHLISSHEI